MYRVRNTLTTKALISIYYTLCYPHLIYYISVWASTWPSFSKKLTIAQNKIFRSIFYKKRYDSTKGVLSAYKFLNFENIHKYFTLFSIYKCITRYQGTQPFRLISTTHNTRGNNVNLICPHFRTVLFHKRLLYPGNQLWNSLLVDIEGFVNNGILNQFKKNVNSYLFSLQQE